jgi:taurine dioxygenase
MKIRKLTPRIGAEILDVDINELTPGQVGEIRATLLDNLVIFFRDQSLTPAQHKAFATRFGPVVFNHNPRNRVEGHPEVTFVLADENSKNAVGDMWHSDGTADEEPPMGSILYLIDVPPDGGGDTLFANTYLAYETLGEPMQRFLEGLTAINDRRYALRGQTGIFSQQEGDAAPVAEHPIVRVHPETGRKSLYINRAYTSHIVGIDRGQSDALLRSLFDHIEQPVFQCRFKWEPGSIAFWDNRCAQHYAIWDYHPHRRYGHRVTISGERPVGVQNALTPADVAPVAVLP